MIAGIPILGICYGMQLINFFHGGAIERSDVREDGVFSISRSSSVQSALFKGWSSFFVCSFDCLFVLPLVGAR